MSDFIVPMGSLPSISSLSKLPSLQQTQGNSEEGADFASILQRAFEDMGVTGAASQDTMMNLALGASDDLHTGAIAAVKSSTAINFASSLVSTAISSYKELMAIQI